MDDEHAASRTDAPGEFAGGPILTPIRRRGESHLLAIMLAAAVIFVAIATAKPWGDGAPRPGASAAATSLVAEVAESSTQTVPPPGASAATASLPTETAQPVFIVVQPGDSGVSTDTYTYTVVCTEDPRPRVSPWAGSTERVGEWLSIEDLACTGATLQRLESVLRSPSAP